MVLYVLRSIDTTVVLEATTQSRWKEAGDTVLLEVAPRTRLQARMGLASTATTYFYGRPSAIKLIGSSDAILSKRSLYTCPIPILIKMQDFASRTIRLSVNPRHEPVAAALSHGSTTD